MGSRRPSAAVTRRPAVVAVDSDRLYPRGCRDEIAAAAGSPDGCAPITSDYGHDGFLIEIDQVGRASDALTRCDPRRADQLTSAVCLRAT